MAKKRRNFTREFKLEALRLAESEGMTMTQVARDLGVSVTSLHRWKAELQASPEAFPGKGHRPAAEEEMDRLRRQLRRVEQERDFLRKTAAYFASKPE
jgi:transposase